MSLEEVLIPFRRGLVIPAHPLALNSSLHLDERRQRALSRYYLEAGAGGLAVGVHTTEFAIHDPRIGLYQPVLELAGETARDWAKRRSPPAPPIMIAGLVGDTDQAVAEARLAQELGYHAGLLSMGALQDADENRLIDHARRVAEVLPIMGFYLQPAAGGRLLAESFWTRLCEIPNLIGIKIAPFNRYHTLAAARAVAASGRAGEVALYTGNDDSILVDLLTPYEFLLEGRKQQVWIAGGLLGHWAFWTRRAVEYLEEVHRLRVRRNIPLRLLTLAAQVTEANEAIFDAANGFRGCISGILYVLTRSGLLEEVHTLGAAETLSPGQTEKIDRIMRFYPHLADHDFVRGRLAEWLDS